PDRVLNCGNSGTSLRLLAGILAAGSHFAVLTGDASLRRRPMARVVEPLRRMGAQLWGRRRDTLAPLAIRGAPLQPLNYTLPVASAQVKSCLLLAGLAAGVEVVLHEPLPSRDHTERLLAALGLPLVRQGDTLRLQPAPLPSFRFRVPGDPSAAAFLVAAAVTGQDCQVVLEGVGLNPTRLGFFHLLRRMGADIRLALEGQELGEPVGRIEARSSELHGVEVGPEEVPSAIDELPLLAVVACRARGVTVVRGAQELRHKESDRIGALVRELAAMGAAIAERPDGFEVQGPCRLRGTRVRCHRDHRLEMSLAVAALAAEGPTRLSGAGWSGVSFPGFWQLFPGGVR
ncbi:MAG TPA: 3-phosphoshikimate 1-carboxyvinyltransferase, partial [Candidatus Nitrosotenuis sp.]|nr:3-phosphoshikimate 1-carboxyvinyltransferase [Candidatus Nitrosotenuis sp.]